MFPAWPQNVTLKKSQQVVSRSLWVGQARVVFLSPFLWLLFFFLNFEGLFILFLCVWAFPLHVYVHTMYMLGACGGQMRAVDLPDLGIHMIVATMWVLESEPRSSGRAASASKISSHLSSPTCSLLKLRYTDIVVTDDNFMLRTLNILRAWLWPCVLGLAFPTVYKHCCFAVCWRQRRTWKAGWCEVQRGVVALESQPLCPEDFLSSSQNI